MATKIEGTAGIEFPDSTEQASAGYTKAESDAAMADGPAFSAYPSGSGQGIPGSSWTKVALSAELFDTNAAFDTATSRFQPTIAGYYQINGVVAADGSAGLTNCRASIYKNGAPYLYGGDGVASSDVSDVIFMNGTTDYIELWTAIVATTPVIGPTAPYTRLSGFLARKA